MIPETTKMQAQEEIWLQMWVEPSITYVALIFIAAAVFSIQILFRKPFFVLTSTAPSSSLNRFSTWRLPGYVLLILAFFPAVGPYHLYNWLPLPASISFFSPTVQFHGFLHTFDLLQPGLNNLQHQSYIDVLLLYAQSVELFRLSHSKPFSHGF